VITYSLRERLSGPREEACTVRDMLYFMIGEATLNRRRYQSYSGEMSGGHVVVKQ